MIPQRTRCGVNYNTEIPSRVNRQLSRTRPHRPSLWALGSGAGRAPALGRRGLAELHDLALEVGERRRSPCRPRRSEGTRRRRAPEAARAPPCRGARSAPRDRPPGPPPRCSPGPAYHGRRRDGSAGDGPRIPSSELLPLEGLLEAGALHDHERQLDDPLVGREATPAVRGTRAGAAPRRRRRRAGSRQPCRRRPGSTDSARLPRYRRRPPARPRRCGSRRDSGIRMRSPGCSWRRRRGAAASVVDQRTRDRRRGRRRVAIDHSVSPGRTTTVVRSRRRGREDSGGAREPRGVSPRAQHPPRAATTTHAQRQHGRRPAAGAVGTRGVTRDAPGWRHAGWLRVLPGGWSRASRRGRFVVRSCRRPSRSLAPSRSSSLVGSRAGDQPGGVTVVRSRCCRPSPSDSEASRASIPARTPVRHPIRTRVRCRQMFGLKPNRCLPRTRDRGTVAPMTELTERQRQVLEFIDARGPRAAATRRASARSARPSGCRRAPRSTPTSPPSRTRGSSSATPPSRGPSSSCYDVGIGHGDRAAARPPRPARRRRRRRHRRARRRERRGDDPDPRGLHRRGPAVHARVRGDSMVDAGILDGDYVVVRQQPDAEPGEIVVAGIPGEEATVKTLLRRRGQGRAPTREPVGWTRWSSSPPTSRSTARSSRSSAASDA